jgi:DNA polymerase III alpha subunit (gram-positive type)
MQNKMLRFLTSLGLADPERFDLDFELVGRDPANPKKVDMAIRKETPWEMSLLEEFQAALATIRYDYTLRFSYSESPSFESVDQLFEDWYLSHYHGIPPFQLTPGKENKILAFIPEGLSKGTLNAIVEDFNALLKWLSYPCSVLLEEGDAPIELPKELKKAAEPQQIQENVVASPEPETSEESDDEEDDESDEDKKCEPASPEEGAVSPETSDAKDEEALPPIDEDEAARQASIAEAEKNYLAEQKANEQAIANAQAYRKGDYQLYPAIQDLFGAAVGNVEFSGNVYATNFRVGRKGGLYGTVGVGDATSAINVRAIESRSGMSAEFLNALKSGDVVRVRGAIEFDKRTGERQIFAHYIDVLPPKPLRNDPAIEKRVELHLHTKMSAMDGLGDIEKYYCRFGHNMGMNAIGRDGPWRHPSFPRRRKRGQESRDEGALWLRVLHVRQPDLHFQSSPIPLRKAKYCVLDFETTGLSRPVTTIRPNSARSWSKTAWSPSTLTSSSILAFTSRR